MSNFPIKLQAHIERGKAQKVSPLNPDAPKYRKMVSEMRALIRLAQSIKDEPVVCK